MLSFIRRRCVCLVGVALAAVHAWLAPPARATNLPPGGTLDPIPLASFPAGAVLERTVSQPFDIVIIVNFVTHHTTGTITQTVWRLPDNTLVFRLVVHNDATSYTCVTGFSTRDFAGFTTDVTLLSAPFCTICSGPDSAQRDAVGSTITFSYDVCLSPGDQNYAAVIHTNAVSYRVPSRILPTASRVTVAGGGQYVSVAGFAYPVVDATPPVVEISAPAQLSDVCNPMTITGRAYDLEGFDHYDLEYALDANGPWTLMSSSTIPVSVTGQLAVWSTSTLSNAYYFIRLTATNGADLTSSITTAVHIDRAFDNLLLRFPALGPNGEPPLLGGTVCFDGTVWDYGGSTYRLLYRSYPNGVFAYVVPGVPPYPGQIITDGLGTGWSTNSGPTAVPDGAYEVRLLGTDSCGQTASALCRVDIDNTAPDVRIGTPGPCVFVNGMVAVAGRATDDHMASWTLQYSGGDVHNWATIAGGITSISGTLGTWNTTGLRPCAYVLRLVASDAANVNGCCGSTSNKSEFMTTVFVGCPADFNRSGTVNSQDFFDFVAAFFAGC